MAMLNKLKKIFSTKGLERLDVGARFRLDRHAYTGTMSKFHMARELSTGKVMGIKLLDPEKLAQFRARFKGLNKPTEGEIGSSIDHPLIAKTLEFGKTTTNQEFILMEFVDGPGLNVLIKQRSEEFVPHRVSLIRQMARSLQGVHEAGFIHRDVCPRNFICHKGCETLKLIDFGLSIPDEAPYKTPGNRTGTPQYMAPEIVRRRSTNNRTDIFSFGVSVYRILTFEHPWGTTDTTGLAALAHDTREPTSILQHRPNLNPALARAIHECLEINPDKRMSSMRRFLSRIRDVKQETE